MPDSFCAATKIIPDRASVHTQERLWRVDFCDGAKLRRADLDSGASHIGQVLCHTSVQCEHPFGGSKWVGPTETEVNIQERGMAFIAPNPLGQRIGHFRVPPSICIKTRLSVQPLIWKWFFILIQIKLIFTRKVVHLASFWKWGFLELESGLLCRLEPLLFMLYTKAIWYSVNIA